MVFKLVNMKYSLLNKINNQNGGDIFCLKDKITRKYITPTKDWLIPLQKLNNDDFNNNGLIMISNIITNDISKNIIVKITETVHYQNKNLLDFYFDDDSYAQKIINPKDLLSFRETKDKNYIDRIHLINKLLSKHINFVKSYCVFTCYENELDFSTYYNDQKSYCNNNKDSIDNIKILLELQDYYKRGSLNEYINKLSLIDIKNILTQLLLSQLEVFKLYGFVHNDLHLGNILIDKSINDITIKYNIFNYDKYIKTKYIYKIIDFDRSILYNDIYVKQYDDDFLNKKKYNYNNTLFKNIYQTIIHIMKLLKDKDKLIFRNILDSKNMLDLYDNTERFIEKDMRTYYNDYIDRNNSFETLVNNNLYYVVLYINDLWLGLYNELLLDNFNYK